MTGGPTSGGQATCTANLTLTAWTDDDRYLTATLQVDGQMAPFSISYLESPFRPNHAHSEQRSIDTFTRRNSACTGS